MGRPTTRTRARMEGGAASTEADATAGGAHDFRPPPSQQPAAPMPYAPKVLRFEGANASTDRSAIASLCAQHGEVAYVDFRFGETVGYVRFRTPEGARVAIAALESGSHQVDGATPSWHLLQQAEMQAYWKAAGKRKGEGEQSAAHAPRDARRGASERPTETGIMLKFDGASADTKREDISSLCAPYGSVAYVDFRFGETSGHVRFRSAEGATAALAALSGGTLEVGGATPSWRVLTLEEEEAYKEAVQSRKRARDEGSTQANEPPSGAGGGDEPSAVLHLSGASSYSTRESLSEACAAHGDVAFVDFSSGETSGYIRFRTAEGASSALSALGSTAVDGATLTWRQLTGAEAQAYRDQVQAAKRARFGDSGGKGKGFGGKGFGGGKGGGKGRGGGFGAGRRGRGRLQL